MEATTLREKTEREAYLQAKMVLTLEEAGELIGVRRSKVYDLIHAKQLKSFLLGTRSRRIHRDDLLAYLNSLRA